MRRQIRDTLQSNTYRFFVDPAAFAGAWFRLDDAELAHQLAIVLRLGRGDRVLLLDGAGWQYAVTIESIDRRGAIVGIITAREPATGEPRLHLTVYLPLIRPERFEWALQKGVELGVSGFVPTICARGMEALPDDRKLTRWRRIIREAAEQARRGCLPHLNPPLRFADACAQAATADCALLLWESGAAPPLAAALDNRSPATLALLSGPEGGLTAADRHIAEQHGIMCVSLGPRTLRAETAPIAAAAAVMYEYGEWE